MDDRTETAFNEIVAELDYPMLVVTAAAGERRGGCLVGFATQSSLDPARHLVCLSKQNHTFRIAERARSLGVHFLPADAGDLARLFGEQTGDEVDKLARCDWEPGPDGVPLLERCRNRFVGRVLGRLDCGDHVAFLLEPIVASAGEDLEPFPFHRAKRLEPGHPA
jgi:flavin reductase (DIM6/NTAB) family NADH-FMN oxidoreductase RutF